MSARYMLDTDICIRFRSRRSETVLNRVGALQAGEASMSVITYGELLLGVEKAPDPRRAATVLGTLTNLIAVEPMSRGAGKHYAVIRADLERRGEVIGANDLWIAAHARSLGLTLVTNNEREFRRVPGLSVENWATA
ncbi:type II toxin-antitoxin system VapC family toxin [Enterovirga rhinocerotis]|uniref:Ribonuclease VapC n=1 Tax=Enterovirga rhinocerotis TaxID=1339210 RepID=A0A4R7BIY3_9HYPH|nr:type II toxin-antitoxin system VapC family toxin [Enterovirga rhinocerotis]TDR85198.1 tRNA(fMet)-specific endonuclease VapC [Enterovirga rhinocerotis]